MYVYTAQTTPPPCVVVQLIVTLGEVQRIGGRQYQWYRMEAHKMNGVDMAGRTTVAWKEIRAIG